MTTIFSIFFAIILIASFSLADGQQLLSNPRCNSWPDRGTCEHEFVVKWYYDRYDHRCRRFFYGGCEGNDNRYDSLEECSAQCQFVEEQNNNRDRCFQPHEPGHCNSDIERWYFDETHKRCVCSWWSGCGGNSNIYYSYNHCMLICGDFAEQGPALDEKYWNRQKNHTMSIESQNVFSNPQLFRKPSEESYSVQVPSDANNFVTINISHRDDSPNDQQYLHSAPLTTVVQNGVTIHRYDSKPRQLQELPRMVNMNTPNEYKIKFDQQQQPTLTQYERVSEALRNEAEETRRRIQEAMRRRVIEQRIQQQQPQPPRDIAEQFKAHLQEHERSLRAKLEAQFPEHVIVLTPEIETVRHPDGRNVVRQRIQWTAHPKGTYSQVTADRREDEAWRQRQAEKKRYFEERQRMKAARYSTTTTPEPTTVIKTTTAYVDDRIYIPTVTYPVPLATEARPEPPTTSFSQVLEERRRQDWSRTQRTTTPAPPTTQSPELRRREDEAKRRRQYEQWLRSQTTTTERTPAEPIEHHRPLIEHVTSAPLSIEDIIAMDNQRNDYDDEYDTPLDFPETSPPRTTTTTTTTQPPRRQPTPTRSAAAPAPIVLPPKKSKLFSEPSSEEYAQDVDFDPYVDFVAM